MRRRLKVSAFVRKKKPGLLLPENKARILSLIFASIPWGSRFRSVSFTGISAVSAFSAYTPMPAMRVLLKTGIKGKGRGVPIHPAGKGSDTEGMNRMPREEVARHRSVPFERAGNPWGFAFLAKGGGEKESAAR